MGLKGNGYIDMSEMDVEGALNAIIKGANSNQKETMVAINEICGNLHEHDSVISDCVSSLGALDRRIGKKASKLGLVLAIVAGIAYIVKNEIDKDELRFQILESDKHHRFETEAERHESEDDTESTFI